MQAWSGAGLCLVAGNHGRAFAADEVLDQLAAAAGMLGDAGWPVFGEVAVAPVHQGDQRGSELAAHQGELVFEAVGVVAGGHTLQHTAVDQVVEPVGQDVAGDPEALLELVEATQPKGGVARDHPGPHLGVAVGRVLGALAAAILLLAVVVARSARHPTPALELSLFRLRRFSVANAALLVFALGFFALLLANVLFLTGVWHYSTIHAGVALTPGPLLAALSAPLGGRPGQPRRPSRRRPGRQPRLRRRHAGPGLGDRRPAPLRHPLPVGGAAGGHRVGLTFAALGSAAVVDLPPARLATGSAILSSFRQIGAVLGIAALIAILGNAQPQHAIDAFHQAWTLIAVTGTGAGLIGLAMGAAHHAHGRPTAGRQPLPASQGATETS